MTEKQLKIMVAMDCSPWKEEHQKHFVHILDALAARTRTSVQPVSVVRNSFTDITELENRERRLGREFRRINPSHLCHPAVLIPDNPIGEQAANSLSDYAKEFGADLLAVATNGRNGLARLLYGSFSESLLFHSTTPLFVVTPHSRLVKRYTQILFPTDFSPQSRRALGLVIPLARRIGAKIIVFNKLDYIVKGTLPVFEHVPIYQDLEKYDLRSRRNQARQWVSWVRMLGVQSEYRIDMSPSYLSEAILNEARHLKHCFIALASTSGQLKSSFFGSITRDLMREAVCPVLVYPLQGKRTEVIQEVPRPRSSVASATNELAYDSKR